MTLLTMNIGKLIYEKMADKKSGDGGANGDNCSDGGAEMEVWVQGRVKYSPTFRLRVKRGVEM